VWGHGRRSPEVERRAAGETAGTARTRLEDRALCPDAGVRFAEAGIGAEALQREDAAVDCAGEAAETASGG